MLLLCTDVAQSSRSEGAATLSEAAAALKLLFISAASPRSETH